MMQEAVPDLATFLRVIMNAGDFLPVSGELAWSQLQLLVYEGKCRGFGKPGSAG